ncbi:hypothetical protein [Mucilaginibacter boryungensis]|uniref:6-bladed beta-propeller protein n=1 Tax=Mucilaginibacter boryungensis TaxID=768480 RepID=A0ABR9XFS7_9SPHI|nr:hypothetical protein [Mucilaginibacter boryungensis]MBE9665839.1 hypothetical protein [Mucilaginibacter boryungensis]
MQISFRLKLSNTIPLCFIANNELLISKSNIIYIYNIERNSKRKLTTLPINIYIATITRFRILARIFRLGVRYAIPIGDDKVLIVFNKKIYELNIIDGSFFETLDIKRGNRPLNIANIKDIKGFTNATCFGEYFFNPNKSPVHIYSRSSQSNWNIVYTFPKETVDHVHAIIPDNYTNCVWILTGDFENGAGIWMAQDNFKVVKPILVGKQIYRACVAYPQKEGLIYATDSQFETNSIRLLKNTDKGWVSELICEINGPAIYGCRVKDDIFISTSVEGNSLSKGRLKMFLDREPGPGVKDNKVHIVGGNILKGFKTLKTNEKDFFPFLIFQFGVIAFPTGDNNSSSLISFNIGLKNNDFDTEVFTIN